MKNKKTIMCGYAIKSALEQEMKTLGISYKLALNYPKVFSLFHYDLSEEDYSLLVLANSISLRFLNKKQGILVTSHRIL